ncbi:MAG: hypothetical protein CUN54_03000 [Phototrophicales bacterium]|nr:MAG: hypothetical protein CUN54_03000 [Phototrophicales bacterium]
MSENESPILIIQDDTEPAQHWPVTRDEIVLGRVDDCDIVLADRQVSRKHIRIFRDGEQYYIEDLNSKNGTWVNGQQLRGVRELQDNDEIQVALATRIQFIGKGSTTPLTSKPGDALNGRLQIDQTTRRVFIGGVELDPPLSLPQYRLLELLYLHGGGICTRDTVVESVWPEVDSEGVSEQAIDALVRRLRDRIAEVDPDWQYIVTVRGHGFRLDNPTD